jgi:hypothetical protein
VQQGRDDGRGVEAIVGEYAGHLDGVSEIGVARSAFLGAVHADSVDIGAVEEGLVGAGIVSANPLDQFILAQELARRGFRLVGRR